MRHAAQLPQIVGVKGLYEYRRALVAIAESLQYFEHHDPFATAIAAVSQVLRSAAEPTIALAAPASPRLTLGDKLSW